MRRGFLAVLCLAAVGLGGWADPLDETYHQTFYLLTIGGGADPPGYLSSMLTDTGGVMPSNVKVGSSEGPSFIAGTHSGYYDYVYDPYAWHVYGPQIGLQLDWNVSADMMWGGHFNGMPWADTDDQTLDVLHNYLETYDDGIFCQKDRFGRIRRDSHPNQLPYDDEFAGSFAPFLELQLTHSGYAALVQDYYYRNNRMAARYWAWRHEAHPDIVVFGSASSEYRMNHDANDDYCDYSDWSIMEFRDWLKPQYSNDVGNLNAAFGLSFADWDSVTPPVTVNWSGGSWWRKWHDFRVYQVNQMEQRQFLTAVEAGMSPCRFYGHQTNSAPNDFGDYITAKLAAPYTTTYGHTGSNGITTYGGQAANAGLFSTIYANDKNWGIFEYNRLSSDVNTNLAALNTAFNGNAHILSPYVWDPGFGQPTYSINGSAFETALRQFIANRAGDRFTGLEDWEVSPDAKDAIWRMSEANDIEGSVDLGALDFAAAPGQMHAASTGPDPHVFLELDETSHFVISDAYHAVSFSMYMSGFTAGAECRFFFFDENDNAYSIPFEAREGWHRYHINLAEHTRWREKRIKHLRLDMPEEAGVAVRLDWVRLHANHCWHFDDPLEIYGDANLGASVAGGMVSGSDTNGDGYFYLSTDKRDPGQEADRAIIRASHFHVLRVRMTSSGAGDAQLYWWLRGDGTPYFQSFSVEPGTHTYTVDLRGNPDWRDHVVRLRLDPVNAAGTTVQVDYVSISPAMLAPRPAAFDVVHNTSMPHFWWTPAVEPDHTGVTYDFQLCDAFDFETGSIVASVSGMVQPRYVHLDEAAALDGLYWWRVRSRDAGGEASPWCFPVYIYVHPWTFDSAQAISGTNLVSTPSAGAGVVSFDTTGGDPYVFLNNGNGQGVPLSTSTRGINTEAYGAFRLRYRVSGPVASTPGQVFFFPESGGFFTADFTMLVDDAWHTVEFDLTGNPDWQGYISRLRVDPGVQSGLTVSFDEAELLPRAGLRWRIDALSVVDSNTVQVTFAGEPGANALDGSNYTLTGPGAGTISGAADSVQDLGAGVFELSWASGEMLDGGDVSIVFTGSGSETAAGNAPGAGQGTGPTVQSIVLLETTPTRLQEVGFLVTFDEPVKGIDVAAPFSDFQLATSGGKLNGASVISVLPSGNTCTVLADTGSGYGAAALEVTAAGVITDLAGNALTGPYSGGPAYTIEPLQIVDQPPALQSVDEGGNVTIGIGVAGGRGVLGYAWAKVNPTGPDTILTAGGANLNLINVRMEDAGLYYCTVSDAEMSVTSATIQLDVLEVNLPAAGPMALVLGALLCLALGAGIRGCNRTTRRET